MRCSGLTILLSAAIFTALPVSADPVVIVSNLTEAPDLIPNGGVDIGLDVGAQSFTVGATTETLQDVELELLGGKGAVDVFLDSDNSGFPGSALLSLGKLTPTGSGFADYTAFGTLTLDANTTYWVVVDYLGAPSWGYTASTSFTGTGTLGPLTNSLDGGTTWRGPFTDSPYLLQVNAVSSIPEPSNLAVIAIGIGAVLLTKRRARQTT